LESCSVKVLVKAGVKIDGENKRKSTALLHSVLSNDAYIVKFLLSHGADPNHHDYEGQTVLARALVEAKPNNEITDHRGAQWIGLWIAFIRAAVSLFRGLTVRRV
jgi:hypothetical protein